MDRNNATIRIGDIVIVKSKLVYYGIPEDNKRELKICLDGQFVILFKYDREEEARRNFDELNKLMKEYLDDANQSNTDQLKK